MKSFISITAILMIVVGACLFRPAFTPAIRDERGRRVPDSVASLEKVRLGGVDQWILIRGSSSRNPLVLFLHGGPGMPMMYLAHAFQRPLEGEFLCVQWDQRGAGKSYDQTIPQGSINIEQYLADAVELTNLLRRRFRQEKVFLVGHSFGSYLGALLAYRHPELYSGYLGVGQEADAEAAGPVIDDFIRRTAVQRGRSDALDDLSKHGHAARETWLFKFGAEIHGKKSWVPLLLLGLCAPEYTFRDVMSVRKGVNLVGRHMNWNAIHGPLRNDVLEFKIPITFFLGRYDYTTPWPLAEQYFDALHAPTKRLVWFESSAHFPFLEEKEKFVREVIGAARQAAKSGVTMTIPKLRFGVPTDHSPKH